MKSDDRRTKRCPQCKKRKVITEVQADGVHIEECTDPDCGGSA